MRMSAMLLAGMICLAQAGTAGEPVDREKVAGLFKLFLRDSAELPMDVAVTTVVTNAKGREIRRKHTTTRLLFRGYSQQAEKFTLTANGSFFHLRELHDSMAPDFAIFKAFSMAVPGKDGPPKLEFAEEGAGVLVRKVENDCGTFRMQLGELIARGDCSAVEFRIGRDTADGLTIRSFRIDARNLPAAANLRYLGACEVWRYHAEGDLQNGYLPGDPRPFLVPKRVVATIETDKGQIVITNDHSMAAPAARKK
jgi:hypothetical protein